MFQIENGCLVCKFGHEKVTLRGWGKDGIRFQGKTDERACLKYDPLQEVDTPKVRIEISEEYATLENGSISVKITNFIVFSAKLLFIVISL